MSAQILSTKSLYNFSILAGSFVLKGNFLFMLHGGIGSQIFKATPFVFASNLTAFAFLRVTIKKLVDNYSFFSSFYGFNWFRFILYSGLGYKRRLYRRYKVMFAYIGHRDWILYKFDRLHGVMPVRRRNYVFFARAKGNFLKDYNFFSSLAKKPPLYKMKGFLDARVKGRFLFVRRIRIRGARTKLSKKQKLL